MHWAESFCVRGVAMCRLTVDTCQRTKAKSRCAATLVRPSSVFPHKIGQASTYDMIPTPRRVRHEFTCIR